MNAGRWLRELDAELIPILQRYEGRPAPPPRNPPRKGAP